jgi:hypothetical protein
MTRLRRALSRSPRDWLAAAWYAVSAVAALAWDTLTILASAALLRLRLAHYHGHDHARG